MPTHQEKDNMIKLLKDQVKELTLKIRTQIAAADMPEKAFNIEKHDGNYFLVKLKYDTENKQGVVVEKVPLGRDYAMVLYKAKQYLVETILLKRS